MGQLEVEEKPFRILSLDGGGSLGVYSLGVLTEIEAMLAPQPLHETLDLIYGTSTGSIIGSLIALKTPVDEIRKHYLKLAPDVMSRWFPKRKSKILRDRVDEVFGSAKFDAFSTDIGIVATHLVDNSPRIFKRHAGQALGRQHTFEPGFGCTIADAVVASCAAYPFFRSHRVDTSHGKSDLANGGFVANNPALFALADALGPLGQPRSAIRLLSIGTGRFSEKRNLLQRWLFKLGVVRTLTPLLVANASTVPPLRKALFNDIHWIRIDDAFPKEQNRTSFTESNAKTLAEIYQLGRQSFGEHELDVRAFFGLDNDPPPHGKKPPATRSETGGD